MKNIQIINNHNQSDNRVILNIVPRGRENALTMREISFVLGITKREVRRLLERARLDGNIIAGTDAGIFIPETDSELKEYVYRSQARIRSSTKSLSPAVSFLEDLRNTDDYSEDGEDEDTKIFS